MLYSYPHLFKLNPGAKKFLDLGCGQGLVSLYAAARGLKAEAVDIEKETPAPLQDIENINYVSADLKDWNPTGTYDIIIAQHSIQFLPKEYALGKLLPRLRDALNPGGVLEIFTFSPEETLDVPTKYTAEEIVGALGGLEIVKQETSSYDGMHRKLGPHTFHEVWIIAKKPAA